MVKEGQPLVKLNDTAARARYGIILSQLRTSRATEARLLAERDDLPEPNFNIDILNEASNDPEVIKIVESQKFLFESRRKALKGQLDVLGQKIQQLQDEINGLDAQEKSAESQIKLLNQEIATVSTLLQKGQALKPRLLSLERQAAQLKGNQGQYASLKAKAKQSITETELQLINTKNEMLNKVLAELKDTQLSLADLEEKMRASLDILQRVVIAAPQSGKITGLNFHTIGGVIAPGTPIMDIIPQDDKLVVDSQIMIQDIDVVHPGLKARVRLTAYKSRTVPTIEGKVVNVSADRFVDKATNIPYYVARIEIDEDALGKLKDVELYPGMSADVLIVTGKKTLLGYLFDPFTAYFMGAFREE